MSNKSSQPDYRAVARDLMKLCKKHGIRLVAHDEGFVGMGPADTAVSVIHDFSASPTEVVLARDNEPHSFKLTA